MLKVSAALVLIYISQAALAADIEDRFPAGSDRGSISELIPNFQDLQVEQTCEGEDLRCEEFAEDQNACLSEGAQYGCFWSYK